MNSVSSKSDKMRIKSKVYAGLEKALFDANKNHLTSCDKSEMRETKIRVEQIIQKLVSAMKKHSPIFSKLYFRNFGVGSSYDHTKIGKADEFDIDVVLKLPELVNPILEKRTAGFVQFQLQNFEVLAKTDPEMHRVMRGFVDDQNYLLSEELRLGFIHKILNEAMLQYFPNRVVRLRHEEYKICKIEHIEPALTLTIEGPNLMVSVDVVASFLLGQNFWPPRNPHLAQNISCEELFLTPARPIKDHPHKERLWRLSFHGQEQQILFHRYNMKSALMVLKRVRDRFKQNVHSYAIKSIFLWELSKENPTLCAETPDFWKSSLGCVVVCMLERYSECLAKRNIPYFWNRRLNLLAYLSDQEIDQYRAEVVTAINEIKENPQSETLWKYLK